MRPLKEFIELRVSGGVERFASPAVMNLARDVGSVYLFELPSDDPRWKEIRDACARFAEWRHRESRSVAWRGRMPELAALDEGIAFAVANSTQRGWPPPEPDYGYSSVWVKRQYAREDLRSAQFLQVIPWMSVRFERTPETTWEIYDRNSQCPMCLTARQKADLIFESEKFPKTRDIVTPYGQNEYLASDRLVQALAGSGTTGYTTATIYRRKRGKLEPIRGWRQLIVTATVGPVSEKTVFGPDVFHPDREEKWRCKVCGLTRGQALVSELHLPRESWDGSEVAVTRERLGGGMTYVFPLQMLMVSQGAYRKMLEHGIKGYRVQIVRLV